MNAIGYARCSTQEQADSGLGIAGQINCIKAYCLLKGLELIETIVDEGISGGKTLSSREGGQRLLRVVRERKAEAVIMLKLDRMFRNASDCLSTIEAWDKSNISLHVIDLGGNAIDTTSAAGRFMLVVLAGAAEMERNLIRERTKSALAVKRSNGQRISGHIPYGFDLGADDTTLLANEQEQAVIREIHTMRDEGMSFPKIAQCLSDKGIPTKNGNGSWNQSTIRAILKRKGT